MTDLPVPSDFLTVLLCAEGKRAAKRYSPEGVEPYSCGYLFEHVEVEVSSLGDLREIVEALSREPRAFPIRGRVLEGSPSTIRRTYREKPGRPAPCIEPAEHRWLMLDLDSGGPEHGGDFAGAILRWRASLPEGLRQASCFFQLSSGQHLSSTLRGHGFFWLDRPYSDLELRRFAKEYGFDGSLYSPVQPHYVAAPEFVGSSDPIVRRFFDVPGPAECAMLPAGIGRVRLREAGEKMLAKACREIKERVKSGGARHPKINEHAYKLGQLCPHILDEVDLYERLRQACEGSDRDHSDDIRNGIEDGKRKPELEGEDWRGELAYADKGFTLLGSQANAQIILRNDVRWFEALSFDMLGRKYLVGKSPFPRFSDSSEINDADGDRLSEWFQAAYRMQIEPRKCLAALRTSARENPFNPVKDYLEDLEWDGISRLATSASLFLGRGGYADEVLKTALVAAVRRVYEPGCKNDYTIVLEGPKGGEKKSSFLEALGGEFYRVISQKAGSKDSVVSLQGAWIADFSELSAFKRGDVETLKDFLTRRVDSERLPYERSSCDLPRSCAFFATTNSHEGDPYIADNALARRLWIIPVGRIRVPTEGERDQLWAEAVLAYRAGESSWELSEATVEALDAVRGARKEESHDLWIEPITTYLAGKSEVTAAEICTRCLEIPRERLHTGTYRRVSRILRGLLWEASHTAKGEVYRAPATWLSEHPLTGGSVIQHALGSDLVAPITPRV